MDTLKFCPNIQFTKLTFHIPSVFRKVQRINVIPSEEGGVVV